MSLDQVVRVPRLLAPVVVVAVRMPGAVRRFWFVPVRHGAREHSPAAAHRDGLFEAQRRLVNVRHRRGHHLVVHRWIVAGVVARMEAHAMPGEILWRVVCRMGLDLQAGLK